MPQARTINEKQAKTMFAYLSTRVRIHNQNMTTAAKAQAERKTFGHLS